MLDIKYIRENVEIVRETIKVKKIGLDLDELLEVDQKLTKQKTLVQELQAERNAHSKKIPKASSEERPALIAQGKEIGAKLDALRPELSDLEGKLKELMYLVPQIPSKEAPIGKDDTDNVEIKKVGELPNFGFSPLDHVELLEKNNWAEFEKIAKVCGSRSYSLKDDLVFLEQSMHRFAMELLKKRGFTVVSMPSFVREDSLYATGHLPTGRDQVYHLPDQDLFLSGTAEVQLNSLHGGEVLKESDLPILYAGHSASFRSEAGSYGRDVRGLIRVHQFLKTEQYIICKNDLEETKKWHQALLDTSLEIIEAFELPYRIIECCTGDMGAGKYRMFDVECWVPSEQQYRETHSCSALLDWQARRTSLRYRDSDNKMQFCHTLNNTAVATPRILVSFLECHQQEDHSVYIPKKLRPYMGGVEFIGK